MPSRTTPSADAFKATAPSFQSSDLMAEAVDLAGRLADLLGHVSIQVDDRTEAQTLRVAEGLARSVMDAVVDVMRNSNARVA